MVSKCICKSVVCNCGYKCVIAAEKSSSSCSRETPLVSLPLQVFGTQICFTSGEHIAGRGMSPAISLDEAAGRAVLGDRGKPLYVLDWPQSRRGHCADLCWMAGRPPLRDGYLVSNYISQHWAKQWAPPPQKRKIKKKYWLGVHLVISSLEVKFCMLRKLKTRHTSAVR